MAGCKGFGFKVTASICVSYYEVDVTDKDKCVSTVKEIAEAINGNIHLLVNGAAYFGWR